jgi:MFS family permease
MTVIGKVGIGFVSDRWGIRSAILITCIMIIAGITLLTKAGLFPIACIFAVIYGFSIGCPLLLNPALTAECLGLAHFGAVFGILSLLNTMGAAVGATLSGVIFDRTGSYLPVFILFMALIAVAAICGMRAKKAVCPDNLKGKEAFV